jgi:Uma2 family endonuclease
MEMSLQVEMLTEIPPEFLDEFTGEIIYPDSDGQPMSDNTQQFQWIVTIQGGLDSLFRNRPDVFVAGDLLWYPVKGQPKVRVAPDILVAIGRPKGHRGSYKQWEEGNMPPQVVFEIMSPSNNADEMLRKSRFYDRHGVEEFYVYDPDRNDLFGWNRSGNTLIMIPVMEGWVSPLLKIRFEMEADTLKIFNPDNTPFLTFIEQSILIEKERKEKEKAIQLVEQESQAKEEALAQLQKIKELMKQKGIKLDLEDL